MAFVSQKLFLRNACLPFLEDKTHKAERKIPPGRRAFQRRRKPPEIGAESAVCANDVSNYLERFDGHRGVCSGFRAVPSHAAHVWLVYAGETGTTSTPWSLALYSMNVRS